MKRLVVLVLCALLLAACASADTAVPVATAVPVKGTHVEAPGGGFTRVTVQELHTMLESKDFTLVNVHIPYDGEIEPTDLFIPYDKMPQNLAQLPDRFARIVLYCRSGSMSEQAARKLVSLGYKDIYDVEGGMVAWEAAGYPLVDKPQ
jgi:rhodanese-related sulfurtransferase